MTSRAARDEIMASIRSGIAAFESNPERISSQETNDPGETAGTKDREVLIEAFRCHAAEESATSERVAGPGDIPQAVVRYLQDNQLSLQVIAAGEIISGGVDWSLADELEIVARPIRPDGDVVVTGCYAGLAEAGAVVTVSSGACPNELQFLAATHIVVVSAGRICADYEAFWDIVGSEFAAGMPRAMNWIVGPSRTADLGVPSRLGAHGPARLHLIIVE